MADFQRSSDVIETYSAKALGAGIGGVIALLAGIPMILYKGMMIGLGWVLAIGGLAAVCYAVYELVQIKKVGGVKLECPYCKGTNILTVHPDHDFSCRNCHRMVPVENGRMLEVNQVRCGFCNSLNFYSERSFGLICESCDHEIPIAGLEGGRKRMESFAVKDDDQSYELILVSAERMSEELIGVLQHMLALNRNQVKDILGNLPQPLLQGIPRKKAELLATQINGHGAKAEYRVFGQQ